MDTGHFGIGSDLLKWWDMSSIVDPVIWLVGYICER
jgi:hypothetical protein